MTPSRAESRLTWLVLVLSLAASVWLVVHAKRAPRAVKAAPSLLGAVPAGPALLLTVDVAALGEATAIELLRAGGGALLGLRQTCGFEPLLGLRQVAFALPLAEAGQTPDFALIAQTTLDQEPVLRCAEAVIRKRGGNPVRSTLGDFRSVRDQKKPLGEIAIRSDGLFVLSGGQYFRDVVDAASGRFVADEAARERARKHAALRRTLEPAQLVVTLLDGPGFPVPGVHSLGASLGVGKDLELRGFVGCYSAAGCGEARLVFEKVKAELTQEPGLASLRDTKLQLDGAALELTGHLPREQLGPLLAQLLAP
ncbi:MAG: hypothetical protein EOO73_35370 [Myxococcales bacterium]|nr:MAG: hypothetical protein EOO73_35370 [Myxococcales bacterium]